MQSGSGVHDTVVNQLLTKIDGVDALNNILLIGMTNRRGPACEKIVMHACMHDTVLPSVLLLYIGTLHTRDRRADDLFQAVFCWS